jgi:sec-independent protein translocase protein TatA
VERRKPMIAAGLPGIGPFELILILAVVVIIFGVGRLGEVGGALGRGIREFRKAARDDDEPKQISNSRKCKNCEKPLPEGATVCDFCGARVLSDTGSPPAEKGGSS